MAQTTLHIFHHITAKKPRVGKVEVAFREDVFIGWDEDHLWVEVGTNGGVMIKVSAGGASEYQDAVAGIIIFCHS